MQSFNTTIVASLGWKMLGFLFLFSSSLIAQNSNKDGGTSRFQQARTPSGHIYCTSMEADSLSRAWHPERGTLSDFEQWLAPHIEEHRRREAESGSRLTVLTIPVVVHVIHNGDALGTGENITDNQVLSQIQVLNQDYRRLLGSRGYNTTAVGADIEVQFCMAQTDPSGNPTNGIHRVVYASTATWNSMTIIDGTLKPATQWDPTQYLNIWTVRFGGSMVGTLGYAQFPDASGLAGLSASGGAANSDGVVISFDALGTNDLNDGTFILNATYNLGRTATHEVGHWLGLRHIWGDGTACGTSDFCNDTPMSDAANFGCPNTNSCTDPAPDPRDMVENYMDYTDDNCMNIFTADQKTRIRTVMSVSPRRASLATSPVCNAPSPVISFASSGGLIVNEATDCSYQDFTLTINIARAPSAAATVTFASTGTATLGTDYIVTPASVVFPTGSTASRTVTLRVYNDALVESAESLLLTLNLATSGDANITTNNLRDYDATINDDDLAPTPTVTDYIINENFEAGTTTFTSTGSAGSNLFLIGTAATASSANWTISGSNATQFAYSNDDACNCNKGNDLFISPVFSLAGGYTSAQLKFDHAFANIAPESAQVRISTNGGSTWTNVVTITNTSTTTGGGIYTSPWVNNVTFNLTPYLGQTNLRISFKYNDGGTTPTGSWMYGLALDNIQVTAVRNQGIQPIVNSSLPDNCVVPANGTVHFFDPTTGRVMGTIQNTAAWNYQCTQMYVNRDPATAGANTKAFWNNTPANYLHAKTFYVNPTSNTPTGTYNITLYYDNADIVAWETATGKSRTALKIVKVSNTPIATVTPANFGSYGIEVVPATLGTFGATGITLTASFASGFSGFGIGDPGPPPGLLPVTLTDFVGAPQQNNTLLKWTTSAEINNDHFVLKRSKDGLAYETLTIVKGNGTTSETHHYQYLDTHPFEGITYYQLEQVDYDQNSTLSRVIAVNHDEAAKPHLTLAPNPASSQIELQYHTPYDSEISFEIWDAVGQKIHSQQSLPMQIGTNRMTVDIRTLPQGVYIIHLQHGGNSITQRFVKS